MWLYANTLGAIESLHFVHKNVNLIKNCIQCKVAQEQQQELHSPLKCTYVCL